MAASPLLQNIIYRLKPTAGDSVPTDISGFGSTMSGGTPTLVDRGSGDYAWQFSNAISVADIPNVAFTATEFHGITIAVTIKVTTYGTDFSPYVSYAPSTVSADGLYLGNAGSGSLRGRYTNSYDPAVASGVGSSEYTWVIRATTSPSGTLDTLLMWRTQVGRSGTAPDYTSTGDNFLSQTLSFLRVGGTDSTIQIKDLVVWADGKTDSECAAAADNLRGVLDATQTSLKRRPARIPRTSQPQEVVQIDWGNPLTNGLVFAAIPSGVGSVVDVVSGQVISNIGDYVARTPWHDSSQPAMATIITTASLTVDQFPKQTGLDKIAGPFTLFAEARPERNANTEAVFFSREPISTGDAVGLRFDDISQVNNGMQLYINNAVAAISDFNVLGASYELRTHRVMVTGDGTNALFYAGGVLVTTASCAALPNANTGRRTSILAQDTSSSVCSGSVFLAWNRVLTLEEYKQLYANPWQVFFPNIAYLPVVSLSPGFRPTSDSSTTGWIATPSGGLYACIDETTTADDADYITSPPVSGTAFPAKFGIGPISAGDYQLNIRAKSSDGGASVLRVKFYDSGNTLLTTAGPLTLTSTMQTFTPTFTLSGTAAYVSLEATTT